MSGKYVYLFEEGEAGMKNLLGGKGANLCEMTNIGLPVPPGFIITTEACKDFTRLGQNQDHLLLAHCIGQSHPDFGQFNIGQW